MASDLAPARNRTVVDDPVALQVVWTRLIAIADEAAATLRRTSFSPIVRESNDFACVIFDAEGNAMAENTIGIPSFNMTLSPFLDGLGWHLTRRSVVPARPLPVTVAVGD